jgi:hypothetical protein
VGLFNRSATTLEEVKKRDLNKSELCKEKGVFRGVFRAYSKV